MKMWCIRNLDVKGLWLILVLSVYLSASGRPSLVLADTAGPPLRLEMSLDKTEFLVAEPIWVDVSLTNTGTDTMWLPLPPLEPASSTLQFVVVGAGDTLPYYGFHADGYCPPIAFAAGESRQEYWDVLQCYGYCVPGTGGFDRYLPAGTYKIQAESYTVTSETVTIRVSEPRGEDLAIHEAIHEALVLKAQKRRSEAADILLPLLGTVPIGSPYRERLEFVLSGILHFDKERFYPMLRGFLSTDPETRYAKLFISDLMGPMSRRQAQAFADSVEAAVPGARVARQARKLSVGLKFRR